MAFFVQVRDRVLCFSHQNHHCLVAVLTCVFTLGLASQLYTLASFLSMGTHLTRLVWNLPQYFREPGRVVVVQGRAPSEDVQFVETIKSYLLSNCTQLARSKQDTFRSRLDELFALWNGVVIYLFNR